MLSHPDQISSRYFFVNKRKIIILMHTTTCPSIYHIFVKYLILGLFLKSVDNHSCLIGKRQLNKITYLCRIYVCIMKIYIWKNDEHFVICNFWIFLSHKLWNIKYFSYFIFILNVLIIFLFFLCIFFVLRLILSSRVWRKRETKMQVWK